MKSFIVETVTPVTVRFIVKEQGVREATLCAEHVFYDYCNFDQKDNLPVKSLTEEGETQIRVIELPDDEAEEER